MSTDVMNIASAIESYHAEMLSRGYNEYEIGRPSPLHSEEINGGFELRTNNGLMAFVTYYGELVDVEEYLDDHPDREDV